MEESRRNIGNRNSGTHGEVVRLNSFLDRVVVVRHHDQIMVSGNTDRQNEVRSLLIRFIRPEIALVGEIAIILNQLRMIGVLVKIDVIVP